MTTNGLTPTTFETANKNDVSAANDALANGKNVVGPKITLYTNHRCPYAHRAHIVLSELQIPYEEILIDLDTPRPDWYLKEINPRGLVPSLKFSVEGVYDDEIITESAVVAQFLADSFPEKKSILPALGARGDGPRAPLERARIKFFTDTWDSKVASFWFGTLMAEGEEEKEKKVEEWVKAVEKEIEPLLEGAKPFFGGKEEVTMAEVHAGPFVVRWYSLAKHEDLLPASLIKKLDALPNFSKWAKAIHERNSITKSIDWDSGPEPLRKKLASIKAAKK
ncbi:hypothetical protein CKM354_000562400 [Cercospora kikuchii]|uniref:Thioredoxin-like protein n=1 Tax=Cercospora kikuchii TaxID=84275 RepID=A0A9P3CKX7_9PEZI|nr:uncharacterized protein CKM354_000562400 [Cercospora kikuchii]GIZ42350.1 hypothetical protein CKM354_000562400 [Cercospora kikuchii]